MQSSKNNKDYYTIHDTTRPGRFTERRKNKECINLPSNSKRLTPDLKKALPKKLHFVGEAFQTSDSFPGTRTYAHAGSRIGVSGSGFRSLGFKVNLKPYPWTLNAYCFVWILSLRSVWYHFCLPLDTQRLHGHHELACLNSLVLPLVVQIPCSKPLCVRCKHVWSGANNNLQLKAIYIHRLVDSLMLRRL